MRFFARISALVFLFTTFIVSIGCGGGSTATQKNSTGQPTITFNAQPVTVTSGASTVLSWNASNANSVSITGLGTFPATGSVKVTPTATTTYTATAAGPGGTSASSTVVSVTTSGPKPTVSFNAQPSSIVPGASAVLNWATTNATSVSIAGVGTFGATGSATVTPTCPVTYTATATGPGGTTASSTTVTVSQNVAPTISFNAQPSTIVNGASSVLSWTTTNASSVSIAGLGNFPANGSTSVTPSTTTTYTATAQGAGGTAQAPATVTVQGVPAFGHVILLME